MHGDGTLRDVFVAHLLPAFAKVGYKLLLTEAIFRDAEREAELVCQLLDGLSQYSLDRRINFVRETINRGSTFPVLKFNWTGLLSGAYKIDILPLIVATQAAGVKLYGMFSSNQLVTDEYVMPQIIADGGRQQVHRLRKQGKLLIYCGDMHVTSRQLEGVYLNPKYKTPSKLSFGPELYRDEETRFIHLTVLSGTVDSLKKASSGQNNRVFEQGGLNFYLERLTGLRPGMARFNLVEQEGERTGILLYNNAVGSDSP